MKKYTLILLFLFVVSFAAFSHAMFLELVEPGVFQVEYDGGGFTPGAKVILYSDGGLDVIQEGVVDDKGFYRFDPSLKVMSAEASDGAAMSPIGKQAKKKARMKAELPHPLPAILPQNLKKSGKPKDLVSSPQF